MRRAGIRSHLTKSPGSPTYRQTDTFYMTEDNPMLLLIPRLVGHGYRTLGEKPAHYDQEYLSKPGQTGIQDDGYADYESIPESEFAWRLQLLDLFHVGKGRLLDVGCATGKFVALAEKAGWDAEGIGISFNQGAAEDRIGVVGSRLPFPDRKIQHAGVRSRTLHQRQPGW